MSYCTYCQENPEDVWHVPYHDHLYGFPVESDDLLFERLVLEINQAGLSWLTILKKAEGFRRAYAHFRVADVARFDETDRARILADAGVIRNRLKVDAAIANANTIVNLQKQFGSFRAWLDAQHPRSLAEWTKLFKKTFRFTGGEIVNEFLMSTGYLPGAHDETCATYSRVLAAHPRWLEA